MIRRWALRLTSTAFCALCGKPNQLMITITAYGTLHGPLTADMTIDLGPQLKDPHFNPDPSFRNLTGYDQPIINSVMAYGDEVRGGRANQLVWNLVPAIIALSQINQGITVGVACKGGRHRSIVVAELIAELLREYGHDVVRVDRDLHLPVAERTAAPEAAPTAGPDQMAAFERRFRGQA